MPSARHAYLIFWIDSNIIHVHAVGHDMIILNSFDAAIELCDKRSSIYSSRWVSSLLERYGISISLKASIYYVL